MFTAAIAMGLAALTPVPARANGADTASAGSSVVQGESAEEVQALTKAAEEGEPVEVLSHRTEASQVFANPSGTFTEDRYATAQWARKGSKLVDIDTSLHQDDGTIQPKAATVGMKFSGGGDAPLATITRDGRSVSLTWPTALPKPSVDGDTVTYPGVLPDVDLKLRATSSGFAQLLVVKSAEAAANPDLKTITYKMAGDGVDVTADEHGNLSAVNPAGQEVFTAPTPRMWDSSPAGAGTQTLSSGKTAEPAAGPQETDEFEPAPGAQQAPMPVTVSDGQLKLTPDTGLMTGKDTTYPVYIDPYVDGSRYSWTIAYKKYPNSSFFNGAGFSGGTTTARAGYENETNGLARSYFRMNTKNLWSTNKEVVKSTFRIKNTWSWSCTKKPVDLWRTTEIGSSTTWNNRPTRREELDSVTDAKGWGSGCPAGNLAFDVTKGSKEAASSHWNTIIFELAASSETDVYGWKKFDAKSAVLSTEYNTYPNAPAGLDTIPSTKNTKGCGNTSPYGLIGNTDIYLTAKGSDSDGGSVKVKFNLWATGHHPNDDPKGVIIVNKTVSASSGTVAKLKVTKAELTPYLDLANGNFSWKAQDSDGSLTSDWTPTAGAPGCRFVFDPTRPSTPPGIASSQFPDGSDGWPAVTGSVRTEGSFALSSGGVGDVTKYEYWTDTDATVHTVSPSSPGSSITVKFTPTTAGTNHVYARSLDKAGNKSDTADYLFYANGLKTADKPGDINGDGNADLYGIDKDGTLNRFYGAGDGTLTQASSPASSTNWTGTQITHRGDWTGDGYEDLISLKHDNTANTDRLRIHPNTGYGFACSDCSGDTNDQRELTVYDDANNHWKNGAKQILAVGDVDGPLDVDNDGTDDVPGYPDLIVNDGTFIWLYYGSSDDRLDSDRDPVLLAGPDDPIAADGSKVNEVTLAAPGDWNNDGQTDLVVRYDRPDVGGLFVFHGQQNDNGYDIGVTDRTSIGFNWSTNTVPTFAAAPDANNDGKLDLWATTPGSGRLRAFSGITASSTGQVTTASDAFTGYQTIG
ncbi:FG-GAP-like repeat-containing protein [Streptomyces sp. NPDC090053]|uniref:FG-GAP-like repeat-containing protein n=1 Tax=Streptomyces sp. NPDC090053 TaxID=3365932 RepID=UPI00382A07EB